MNAKTIDFDTVMANLNAQRATAKAEYEAKMAKYDDTEALMVELFKTASNSTTKSVNGSKELQSNAFDDMTVFEATKSYLEFCGKPKTSKEIANALINHGIQTSSKNFINTLTTILYKYQSSKEVVRQDGKKWKLGNRRIK